VSERISVNGVITEAARAVVPAMDHGFLFGDSVYETLRTYAGQLFRYDDHFRRLCGSGDGIGLKLPLGKAELRQRTLETMAEAGEPDAAVRIVVTRGVGPMNLDPEPCAAPNVLVYVRPRPRFPAEAYETGLHVAITSRARNSRASLDPNVKSGNYLNNVLAYAEAKRAGAQEGVMLNAEGHVTEGCTSNVFIVEDGVVLTPPLSEGLLSGITRKVVLEICARDGRPCREEAFGPDDLRGADEVFLTSTLKQVMPVGRVDGRPVGGGTAGPTTLALLGAYRAQVKAETGVDPGVQP
jgi:branched-chain amino acid aminotransferase